MNNKIALDCEYEVYTKSQIGELDYESIIALYQPIIGFGATSLYATLLIEAKLNRVVKEQSYIKRIIKLMNVDLQSLTNFFNILEAIGLIKTFYNSKENKYVFALYGPEKASGFFDNPLLVNKLNESLKENDFNKTKAYFKKYEIDTNNYQDISKKYKDVFSFEYIRDNVYSNEEILMDVRANISSDLDLDLIKEALKPINLHYLLLENKVVKTLEMLFLTYSITSDELIQAIIEVASEDELNLDELSETIKMIDKLKKTPSKLDHIYLRNNEGATLYEKYSVFDYLSKNYNHLKLSQSLYLHLEKIMKSYKLSNGVMNIMLDVGIKQTNSLNINYLEVIAKEWSNSEINTVNKALERSKSIIENQNKSKANYSKVKTIGSTKGWYQNENESELSEDEIAEMNEIIKMM